MSTSIFRKVDEGSFPEETIRNCIPPFCLWSPEDDTTVTKFVPPFSLVYSFSKMTEVKGWWIQLSLIKGL